MDAATAAAVAALAVATLAFIVAVAQALQQYFITGQLIRLCDSVVFGPLPGHGRRVWQMSQLRFRVVYKVPRIELAPDLWPSSATASLARTETSLGTLTALKETKTESLRSDSPLLPITIQDDSKPPHPWLDWYWTTRKPPAHAGEASWASFVRAVYPSCQKSTFWSPTQGDADRCPTELPTVPMPASLRDTVVLALMSGMECTAASFERGSVSMQGMVGTITSAQHPVLGPIIHFSPRPTDEKNHIGLHGSISRDWLRRTMGTYIVAGRRYNKRERIGVEKHQGNFVFGPRDTLIPVNREGRIQLAERQAPAVRAKPPEHGPRQASLQHAEQRLIVHDRRETQRPVDVAQGPTSPLHHHRLGISPSSEDREYRPPPTSQTVPRSGASFYPDYGYPRTDLSTHPSNVKYRTVIYDETLPAEESSVPGARPYPRNFKADQAAIESRRRTRLTEYGPYSRSFEDPPPRLPSERGDFGPPLGRRPAPREAEDPGPGGRRVHHPGSEDRHDTTWSHQAPVAGVARRPPSSPRLDSRRPRRVRLVSSSTSESSKLQSAGNPAISLQNTAHSDGADVSSVDTQRSAHVSAGDTESRQPRHGVADLEVPVGDGVLERHRSRGENPDLSHEDEGEGREPTSDTSYDGSTGDLEPDPGSQDEERRRRRNQDASEDSKTASRERVSKEKEQTSPPKEEGKGKGSVGERITDQQSMPMVTGSSGSDAEDWDVDLADVDPSSSGSSAMPPKPGLRRRRKASNWKYSKEDGHRRARSGGQPPSPTPGTHIYSASPPRNAYDIHDEPPSGAAPRARAYPPEPREGRSAVRVDRPASRSRSVSPPTGPRRGWPDYSPTYKDHLQRTGAYLFRMYRKYELGMATDDESTAGNDFAKFMEEERRLGRSRDERNDHTGDHVDVEMDDLPPRKSNLRSATMAGVSARAVHADAVTGTDNPRRSYSTERTSSGMLEADRGRSGSFERIRSSSRREAGFETSVRPLRVAVQDRNLAGNDSVTDSDGSLDGKSNPRIRPSPRIRMRNSSRERDSPPGGSSPGRRIGSSTGASSVKEPRVARTPSRVNSQGSARPPSPGADMSIIRLRNKLQERFWKDFGAGVGYFGRESGYDIPFPPHLWGRRPGDSINWFWLSQTDIIPGFWATPWHSSDYLNYEVCHGASNVAEEAIRNVVGKAGLREFPYPAPRGSPMMNLTDTIVWMDAGRRTYPRYAYNGRSGVVCDGVFDTVALPGSLFADPIPIIELLQSPVPSAETTDLSLPKARCDVERRLIELMRLDAWLSTVGGTPEIQSGPSDLLRQTPALVQELMDWFRPWLMDAEASNVEGGAQKNTELAGRMTEYLVEGYWLTPPESLYVFVAVLRAVKVGQCVLSGPDTAMLADIMQNDVQVCLV